LRFVFWKAINDETYLSKIELPDLTGKSVFIAAGTNDPICSPEESSELQSLLEQANAKVELHWENRGHQLTAEEVRAAAQWYQNL
jgi:phospholipase/carboxylesterase